MDVALHLEHELLAVEDEHEVHEMVAITAPSAPVGETRPPRYSRNLRRKRGGGPQR